MTAAVTDHYDEQLGPIYTWMIADIDAALARSDAETTVIVHDLLHEKEGATWRLRVSSYAKLRLSPQWVVEKLESHGLIVHREPGLGGMIRISARKPRACTFGKTDATEHSL